MAEAWQYDRVLANLLVIDELNGRIYRPHIAVCTDIHEGLIRAVRIEIERDEDRSGEP